MRLDLGDEIFSVTRFDKILPLWQNLKSLWAIFGIVDLVFGKLLYLRWQFLMLLSKF